MISKAGLKAQVCGLARANKSDIDAAADAGLQYVHTFIATSDIHLEYKLHMSRKDARTKAVEAVEYAKSRGMQVEFSAEDATRTDREFLHEVFVDVAKAGADRLDMIRVDYSRLHSTCAKSYAPSDNWYQMQQNCHSACTATIDLFGCTGIPKIFEIYREVS